MTVISCIWPCGELVGQAGSVASWTQPHIHRHADSVNATSVVLIITQCIRVRMIPALGIG